MATRALPYRIRVANGYLSPASGVPKGRRSQNGNATLAVLRSQGGDTTPAASGPKQNTHKMAGNTQPFTHWGGLHLSRQGSVKWLHTTSLLPNKAEQHLFSGAKRNKKETLFTPLYSDI